ncbi:MAG: hypothetical protein AAFP03_14725 [Cyanobacteria bacterium J06598_3]
MTLSCDSLPRYRCLPSGEKPTAALLAILIATGGVAFSGQSALAQTASNVNFDPISGAVQVDNNAFDIQTGALENDSDIPLPALLPTETREGLAQPVVDGKLAPNTVEFTPDVTYINQSFNEILQNSQRNAADENPAAQSRFDINAESLEVTTQFNLSHREGSHAYGEGIEVTVFGENGEVISQESTFVRGDRVNIGPDGQPLPDASQLNVSYGAGDKVQLRVLNLRRDGQAPSESGIYFNNDGEFIVEDLQNGGDLDFDDGNYLSISEGRGAADGIESQDVVSVETQTTETPLAPEVRVEQVVEEEIIENVVESDTVATEEREWGSVSLPDELPATRIGHAESAVTDAGETLVYDRYTGGSQLRAGSDGLGFTGQLKPLVDNPNVPPTLLSGNLTFNPFVGDNEAGLTGSLGITQFITPTHRLATDALGNVIDNPDADGDRLVEPGGLFTNRRLVGYVPPTPEETVLGNQLFSDNGIFQLPADQSVVINPSDAQKVGRGNAAYTNNVGGVLIEAADGEMSFVPQWTAAGYEPDAIALDAGEARRVIYALVPQQAGQNLALGQRYDVNEVAGGYEIAAGGFSVISADRQPQNFAEETTEVYAVEDTLPGNNAVTALFNGIQGTYAEAPGGPRVPTVDVGLAAEADARVGNTLFPLDTIAGDPGQQAYGQTTRAAGFYLGGSVTGGIGNQRDQVRSTTIEMDQVVEELLTRRTLRTFETPIVQLDTAVTQRTETTESFGSAFFDINKQGELTNVNFIERDGQTTSVANDLVETKTSTIRGEETLVSEVTSETTELLNVDTIEMDRQTTDGSDSYANFSAVQGELALGGVLNFGNTPWSSAANTVRAELFAEDTVLGRGGSGSDVGWRAEALFHPFGEVQREAYQYDADGNAVPVYQTMPVMDANGEQVVETLTAANGELVDVLVNAFELDADGNRVLASVGTGKAKGPGVYVRIEDAFGDDEGVTVAGGLQLSF